MALGDDENCVILHDAGKHRWLLFRNPLQVYRADTVEAIVTVFRAVEHQVEYNGLHAAGFISYEAGPAFDPALASPSPGGFPFLWFGLYREPEQVTFPPLPAEAAATLSWEPSISQEKYQDCFRKIKAYIRAGETYQINYTFRLRGTPFPQDPWELFVRMVHAQGFGYGAYVNLEDWAVCSASPELFFTLADGVLRSRPMKGTIPRAQTQAEDLAQADRLAHSQKNRAENVMIVDMVRNDMGRIADGARVAVPDLFAIEKYPTLWQMTSTVHCSTGASVTDIFGALFPAASITGAPKVRATHIIAELENTPRRIYTGTVGFFSPGRKAQFNVAIRTVLIDKLNKTAEYGVGGGIVWDSEEVDELDECHTKARILTRPTPPFALLETLLWTPQAGYFLLESHLERLAASAAYFSRTVDIKALREQLNLLADTLPAIPHRIRLTLPPEQRPEVEAHPLVAKPRPYRIRLAQQPVNARDPFLYHKTTHRRVYEKAKSEAPGYDDVVLWNEKKEVTESCIANIVVEREGRLLTPPACAGLLPGTYRSLLLKEGLIIEESLSIEDLHRCARIYLINSVRGMWEIRLDWPAKGRQEITPD